MNSILVLNTEWHPMHGGVSSLNRELCISLAAAGQRVVCLVPSFTEDELTHARSRNVELISGSLIPGLNDLSRLCLPNGLPTDFHPFIIVGHDRITGPYAIALRESLFPDAKVVFFVHTSPTEIEWYKENQGACARGENREKLQIELALRSDLVVAIGPRLYRDFATAVGGHCNSPPIVELNPGFHSSDFDRKSLPHIQILLLGRAEDKELKGLDIASKAVGLLHINDDLSPPPILVVRGAQENTAEKLKAELCNQGSIPESCVIVREYTSSSQSIGVDLRRASALVMPSRSEGFGLVALEAIGEGVPLLVSANSGVAEVLRQHLGEMSDEFIVKNGSDDAETVKRWSECLRKVLRDRGSANSRANEIRTELFKTMNWDAVGRKFMELVIESFN